MIMLKYLFYKLYKLAVIIDADNIPEHRVGMIMSLLEFLNLVELYILTSSRVFFTSSRKVLSEEIIAIVIIYLLLAFFNYLLCIRHGRYLIIERRFRTESRKRRIIGTILVSLYILITVFLTFYAAYKS